MEKNSVYSYFTKHQMWLPLSCSTLLSLSEGQPLIPNAPKVGHSERDVNTNILYTNISLLMTVLTLLSGFKD